MSDQLDQPTARPDTSRPALEALLAEAIAKRYDTLREVRQSAPEFCDCGHRRDQHVWHNDRVQDVQWYTCPECLICSDYRPNNRKREAWIKEHWTASLLNDAAVRALLDRVEQAEGGIAAADKRIAALCDAHEEQFLRAESAEATVAQLRALIVTLNSNMKDRFAHHGPESMTELTQGEWCELFAPLLTDPWRR